MASRDASYGMLLDIDYSPEIYETPELADDVSTIQTPTHNSDSPSPVRDGKQDPEYGLDRQRIDQDEARRRFEPSRVDARSVDFSDTIHGRRSYKISTRRRRRKQAEGPDQDCTDSEDETLQIRLARLLREAQEVKIELAHKRDTQGDTEAAIEETAQLESDLSRLSSSLNESQKQSRGAAEGSTSAEEQFRRQLDSTKEPTGIPTTAATNIATSSQQPSSDIAATAEISDRISALETALGLSSVQADSTRASILPTLASLTTQISTLTIYLSGSSPASNTTSKSTSPLPTLDALSTRLAALTTQTDKLTAARITAKEAYAAMHQARLQNVQYKSATTSASAPTAGPDGTSAQLDAESQTALLTDQSSKINALYSTLPTLQSLTPLLPTVLERLRSLSSIHAGAAEAASDLAELESRQESVEGEIKRWREALEQVEGKMREGEAAMRRNAEVIGKAVKNVEDRVERLQGVS